ncbi:MAG TPA: YdiU family protein [Pseudomonadota bacterium]|nr:YdiU family protein [Pseudomonadota bacterium]
MSIAFGFDHSYARALEGYYARVRPSHVKAPRLLKLNTALAEGLGLDVQALSSQEGAAIFSGNELPSDADPIAMAYAGHQFGHFVPQLGDGRAILLGEVIGRDGIRRDIQLKGAGQTPFSRRGDGRAALGPVLREYLISEAMYALGIPATRALAAVATGEPVYRESVLPGAIFTRVAQSHIRVGTFEFFARRGDDAAIKRLADYVIARHYPELPAAGETSDAERYLAFLDAVMARQADLVSRWMMVGFIHGVMNTDNTSVAGETIDFGPCAFMDRYDPQTVFSSIDEGGRYAYANQPPIVQWNLARFAETLLPLLADDPKQAVAIATERIVAFEPLFEARWLAGMRRKLGLQSADPSDESLAQELLEQLHASQADFTLSFRQLCNIAGGEDVTPLRAQLRDGQRFDAWLARWRQRTENDPQPATERAAAMRRHNPAFIPRNHRVEEALERATQAMDLSAFEQLSQVLSRPYDDQPDQARYAEPAPASSRPYRTFCGT